MKRSRMGPKTYEEALAKTRLKPGRQRHGAPRECPHNLADGTPCRFTAYSSRGMGVHQRRAHGLPTRHKRMKRATISPEEKAWREEVLKRDGYQCRWIHTDTKRRCRRKGKELHAHHIHERSQRPDLKFDVRNGAALCSEHHDTLHHTVTGRQWGRFSGLLGTETYEAAQKKAGNAA